MFPQFQFPPLARTLIRLAFILTVALGAFNLTMVPPVYAGNGTIVRIDPPNAVLNPNHTAVVNVRIENANNLAGAELHLLYNPSVIEVQKLEAGDMPAPDYVVQSKFGEGRIDYAVAQMPNQHPAASGNGVMLRITFHARGNGSSVLDLGTVILADAKGKPIPMVTQAGEIYVNIDALASPTSSAPSNSTDVLEPVRSFVDWLLSLIGVSK